MQKHKNTFSSLEELASSRELPRAVSKQMDLTRILIDAMVSVGKQNPYRPVIALSAIESYLAAAKMQQRRIQNGKKLRKPTTLAKLFADTHFYLICWDKIQKLAKSIQEVFGFPTTKRVLRVYHLELKKRCDAVIIWSISTNASRAERDTMKSGTHLATYLTWSMTI
jgi:hypothetical protein